MINLWKHQATSIERARYHNQYGLFWEPGTGKTGTIIHMLRDKYNSHKRILRTLIFCPLIVVRNWKDEFAKHSNVDPKMITTLDMDGAKRLALFKEHSVNPKGAIFVTNYEALVVMPKLFEAFQAWHPEIVVCDESHKIKDFKSKRTKQAIKLVDADLKLKRPAVKHRYIMTGTPVLNSPMDLFTQFRVLDGGLTFGKKFYNFRAEYFYDKNAAFQGKNNYFPDWQVRPGAFERIHAKIYQYATHVKKSECLDLPPLVRQVRKVGMTGSQAKAYKEMKKDFITFLEGKAVVAELALTKALRLLQIASGYVKFADGEEKSFEKTPKMQALSEELEILTKEHKVLVWSVFKENYAQIKKVCEDLGIGYVEVHGEIPNTQKFENVNRFNADPRIRVFIGHPGSGGIGINLVSASYAIFYSRNFSLENDLQAEARNYRGGSEIHARITRIDLITEGTIDELVMEALANKQKIGEEILTAWKNKI